MEEKKNTHTHTRSLPKIHSKTFNNSIWEVLFLWMPLLTPLSYPQAPQRRWDDMLLLLRRSSPVHLRVPTLPLWQCRSTRPLARPGDLETDRNTRGKGMCRWFIGGLAFNLCDLKQEDPKMIRSFEGSIYVIITWLFQVRKVSAFFIKNKLTHLEDPGISLCSSLIYASVFQPTKSIHPTRCSNEVVWLEHSAETLKTYTVGWFRNPGPTHQLREVASWNSLVFLRFSFYIPGGWPWDFWNINSMFSDMLLVIIKKKLNTFGPKNKPRKIEDLKP